MGSRILDVSHAVFAQFQHSGFDGPAVAYGNPNRTNGFFRGAPVGASDARNGDGYALLASEWKRNSGQVTYDGKKWSVTSDDAYATLLVDMRKIDKVSVNSRVAKGRPID